MQLTTKRIECHFNTNNQKNYLRKKTWETHTENGSLKKIIGLTLKVPMKFFFFFLIEKKKLYIKIIKIKKQKK